MRDLSDFGVRYEKLYLVPNTSLAVLHCYFSVVSCTYVFLSYFDFDLAYSVRKTVTSCCRFR